MKKNIVAKILQKVASKVGAEIVLEPKWGKVGQIIFKSGRKRYFRYSTLDLNRVGASDIARDKDYAKFFMKRMGYPVIKGKAFCTEKWAIQIGSHESMSVACAYAYRLGWPVIVKPNSQSQGRCVFKTHTRREFETAFKAASKVDSMILVETFVTGHDYRLVVLDGKVISAYERIPLSVTGDGKLSILNLLEQKQIVFRKTGRDTILKLNDRRIADKLARMGLSLDSCIPKGQLVYLLDNANLSSGGDSLDVTKIVHHGFKELAVHVTKDMGLTSW